MGNKQSQAKNEERKIPRLVPTPEDEAESRLRVGQVIEEARTKYRGPSTPTREAFKQILRKVSWPIADKPEVQCDDEKSET